MDYQKQNFQDGEVLTAKKLNHIEDGIKDQEESIKQIMVCNRNFLDNWYFGNPVNQRGKAEYSGANYAIDRWRTWDSNTSFCKIVDEGIQIAATFYNKLESEIYRFVWGKTCTISILFADGTLFSNSFSPAKDTWHNLVVNQKGIRNVQLGLYSSNFANGGENFFRIQVLNTNTFSETILAVKLELGSTQTLAHQENGKWVLNEIPNYAEELRKCQRYFHVYNTSAARPTGGMYDCVPTMRTDPIQSTITTADGKTLYANFADL